MERREALKRLAVAPAASIVGEQDDTTKARYSFDSESHWRAIDRVYVDGEGVDDAVEVWFDIPSREGGARYLIFSRDDSGCLREFLGEGAKYGKIEIVWGKAATKELRALSVTRRR
jgi:hypothetical protein